MGHLLLYTIVRRKNNQEGKTMALLTGPAFINGIKETFEKKTSHTEENDKSVPRRSLVQIYFSKRDMTLTYYNDKFDLHRGDIVYVDGKLEGMRGCVTGVNYNFKIRSSEYKRVIALVDTDVKGQFFMAGSHFISFERDTLPVEKAMTWFKEPIGEEDEYLSNTDDTFFLLDDLTTMDISGEVAERGHDYYMKNHVKYLCLDGTKGYAIVEGNENYELEFTLKNGKVSGLTCSCFCNYNCKHDFAVMLQLKESLKRIEDNYAEEYKRTNYFAAIDRDTLFSFAIDGKEKGTFTL